MARDTRAWSPLRVIGSTVVAQWLTVLAPSDGGTGFRVRQDDGPADALGEMGRAIAGRRLGDTMRLPAFLIVSSKIVSLPAGGTVQTRWPQLSN